MKHLKSKLDEIELKVLSNELHPEDEYMVFKFTNDKMLILNSKETFQAQKEVSY